MKCEQTLECPDILFMRRILPLQMQMQGKKRSKRTFCEAFYRSKCVFRGEIHL